MPRRTFARRERRMTPVRARRVRCAPRFSRRARRVPGVVSGAGALQVDRQRGPDAIQRPAAEEFRGAGHADRARRKAHAAPPARRATARRKGAESQRQHHAIIEMAAKKRAERDKLEANVDRPRASGSSAAKAALDSATPGGRTSARSSSNGRTQAHPVPGPVVLDYGRHVRHGRHEWLAPRSNCYVANNANGTPVQTCRTLVPSEAYYDRIKTLQDAVKSRRRRGRRRRAGLPPRRGLSRRLRKIPARVHLESFVAAWCLPDT